MIKTPLKIFIVCVCFFTVFSLYFNLFLSISNYSYNKNQSINQSAVEDGLLNHQNEMSNYKFGAFNLNYNGCGIIASYNILKLIGKEEKLEDIIKEYDLYGSNFFGVLGVNPLGVKRFFNRRGAQVKFVFNKAKFETEAKNSQFSMIVYASFKGGHYWLLDYDDVEKFKTVNPWGEYYFNDISQRIEKNIIKFLITFNF